MEAKELWRLAMSVQADADAASEYAAKNPSNTHAAKAAAIMREHAKAAERRARAAQEANQQ